MDVVWLDAETVTELNRVALEEGETHALNPGSDLDGALNRPKVDTKKYVYSSVILSTRCAICRKYVYPSPNARTELLCRPKLDLGPIRLDGGASAIVR